MKRKKSNLKTGSKTVVLPDCKLTRTEEVDQKLGKCSLGMPKSNAEEN
jgi:hypothetical protein